MTALATVIDIQDGIVVVGCQQKTSCNHCSSKDSCGTGIVSNSLSLICSSLLTGVYFYDSRVFSAIRDLKPSKRGELEITDLNNMYLQQGMLNVELMGRGSAWLDTGTHDSLLDAGLFVQTLERRQSLRVGCPEEVSWRKGWISEGELRQLAEPLKKCGYGQYLLDILNDRFI